MADPAPPDRQTVAAVMSPNPALARENDDVADVADLMVRSGWRSMPVVRVHNLVGIVSRSDVIRALDRTDEQIAVDVRNVVQAAGSGSGPCR